MSAILHKHTWQHFARWGSNAWRCTSAKTRAQLEHLCEDGCNYKHHFEETGCGATLVRWHKRSKYFFCAPGVSMIRMSKRPQTMVIDEEYLKREASFHEGLKRLVA